MPRYFVCRVRPSGIGDQLYQLRSLYNIGRSFCLAYLHQRLPANDWAPELDHTDFLGLGLGERNVLDFPDLKRVEVDAFSAARALAAGQTLADVLPKAHPSPDVVELVFSARLYGPERPRVPLRFPFDVRKKLLQRHASRLRTIHRPDHLTICVHVRRGDITWVRIGQNFVFVGQHRLATRHDDEAVRRGPPIEDYHRLLTPVLSELGTRPCAVKTYSDGRYSMFPQAPRRGTRHLSRAALRHPKLFRLLALLDNRTPLGALYNPFADRDVQQGFTRVDAELAEMCSWPNGELHLGRDAKHTEEAILAFAAADIVIMATNPGRFPLLGMLDPATQAFLALKDPVEVNLERLRAVLPGLDARANRLAP
jgi:hypothetical protein